ncbi:MAG: uroporphyrinogen-III C-methyltransferase [Euryarchaeota archaeon]|nr:uroporphyrinogen-III C-methyltransferase [Euryarchaeota archaeon]
MNRTAKTKGKVFLVGAGPGDPRLLTRHAEQIIRQADVILYDKLVDKRVIELASPNAELIDVGKDPSHHKVPQHKINELLIQQSEQGKVVIRLKGGDPFVFGRGGEEAEQLIKCGIDVEVIPGISSAIAVPAYAGIPVTHRKYASSVTIVTGHEARGNQLQWDVLAKLSGTLIVLMGVGTLAENLSQLMQHGKPIETPAAVIARGTTEQQQVVVGTLGDLQQKVQQAGVSAPAVLVIGDVVGLREILKRDET